MALLIGTDAFALLKKHGIPCVDSKVVSQADLDTLKIPVILKAISPKLRHRDKEEGIKVVHHKDHLQSAYTELRKLGEVLAQPVAKGHKVAIRIMNEPEFGKVVVFGLMGHPIEVYDDVSFRIVPLKKKDALEMIQEIKALTVLKKAPAANLDFLANILVGIGDLALKEHVTELELEPFVINDKIGVVEDARIVI